MKRGSKKSHRSSKGGDEDENPGDKEKKRKILNIYSSRAQGSLKKYRSENKIQKHGDDKKQDRNRNECHPGRLRGDALDEGEDWPFFHTEKSKNILDIEHRNDRESSGEHTREKSSRIQDRVIKIWKNISPNNHRNEGNDRDSDDVKYIIQAEYKYLINFLLILNS